MNIVLGNVFCLTPDKVVVGKLCYEDKYHVAHIGLDLVTLLPVCRKLREGVLNGCCLPGLDVLEPPFIEPSDLQICGRKGKRVKVGYVYTMSDHRNAAYQIRFDIAEVLKHWDYVRIHCHIPTEEELKERDGCATKV